MGEITKIKFRRVNVISFALFQAIFSVFLGIVSGIILTIIQAAIRRSMGGLATISSSSTPGVLSLFGSGAVTSFVLIPILFAIIGFLTGIIVALVFNLSLKIIGGLKMDLEEQ